MGCTDTSAARHFGSRTLRQQRNAAEVSGHFGSTADVSYGHFGSAAVLPKCLVVRNNDVRRNESLTNGKELAGPKRPLSPYDPLAQTMPLLLGLNGRSIEVSMINMCVKCAVSAGRRHPGCVRRAEGR